MPKLQIRHDPEMTPEQVMQAFQDQFQGKYEVYPTKLIGVDFVVKKSPWTGVAVRLLQKGDRTLLRFNAITPSTLRRAFFAGLIPYLILHLTSWKGITSEVRAFIEGSQALQQASAAYHGPPRAPARRMHTTPARAGAARPPCRSPISGRARP